MVGLGQIKLSEVYKLSDVVLVLESHFLRDSKEGQSKGAVAPQSEVEKTVRPNEFVSGVIFWMVIV